MGWQTQQDYEDAERERELIAQWPMREKVHFRLWQVCGVVIVVCAVSLFLALAINARAAPIDAGDIEVVDGDTVRAGGEVYRLVGFNTPEPGRSARCEAERTLAARATFRLRRLVASHGVELERVLCACRRGTEGTRACNYGRLCGVLRVGGRDVAATMIAEGLAEQYVCGDTRCPARRDWCK